MGDEFKAAMSTIITLDDLRHHVTELWGARTESQKTRKWLIELIDENLPRSAE